MSTDELPLIEHLDELTNLVIDTRHPLYLRYSKGPASDAREGPSRDYEAHLTLPGWSATSITPETWWQRPREEWIARRIRKYAELSHEDGRYGWILTGTVVGHGPDHEPLLAHLEPVAQLSTPVLDEAAKLYHERFDVGCDSTGHCRSQ